MSLESRPEPPETGGQRTYVTLFMAICLMAAIGIAATTYDSTLQTDPDEVIDVKHSWLPIGKEAIKQFTDPKSQAETATSADGASGGSAGAAGAAAAAGAAGAGSGGGGEGAGEGAGTSNEQEPPPCTEGLVGLLASLFPMLIPPCGPFYLLGLLLPLVGFLAAVALSYRYRTRLIALAHVLHDWVTGRSEGDDDGFTWPSQAPANDVQGAWLAMVERADIDRPWTRTPVECARGAVDAGMNSEAVTKINTLFEEVRYGDAPLTEERRQRAREWRERLDEHRG